MPTFYVTVISAFPITSLSVSFGRSCSELKYSGLHLFQNALAKHCDSGDFIWKILSMLFFFSQKNLTHRNMDICLFCCMVHARAILQTRKRKNSPLLSVTCIMPCCVCRVGHSVIQYDLSLLVFELNT